MLGSVAEAEDAVQDTLLRAWRASDSFEGRAAVRSWLYRIATNVCLDMLKSRKRRARPVDLGPAGDGVDRRVGAPLPEPTWIEPVPDVEVLPATDDPPRRPCCGSRSASPSSPRCRSSRPASGRC